MHKVKRPIQKLKFLLLTCTFTFYLWPLALNCFAQDKIVAIVNNDIITQKDLNDYINFTRMQLAEDYQGEKLESKIQSMKINLLDRLIEDRLILQEAKKNNIKADENRVKAKIDEIKKRYNQDSEFQEVLARQGLVQADIEARIKEQLLMYNIIDIKVKSRIMVNPTEVTDFYDKNLEALKLSEIRELEVISIKDVNLASEISGNLKNGQRLEDLIKKYSLSVDKLRVTEKGELRQDIEKVVFKLKPQEISGPVKVQETYYIFKLDNIIAARQPNLSEVQDKIHGLIFNQKMQEELTRWLGELKKNAYIKIS